MVNSLRWLFALRFFPGTDALQMDFPPWALRASFHLLLAGERKWGRFSHTRTHYAHTYIQLAEMGGMREILYEEFL